MDETVVGRDHVDIERFHNRQGLEGDSGIWQHYVVEIFLDPVLEFPLIVVLVGKAHAACDVLAEDIVADEQFVFRNIADHAVRPVQHAGFLENDPA